MSLRDDLERAARDLEDRGARERTWRVVRDAYEQLEPRPRRRPWRAFLATALLAVVGAAGVAAASAPRSDVGRFVRGVLGVGEPRARPALVHVPGGGRLLVAAGDDAWIVAADGAKRRLGAYAGASWSPRGRFAVAWRGRELTAVDPVGRVRWSLAHESAVTDARWAPDDGFLVAYRAGGALRVVGGDGAGDRRLAGARAGRGAGLAAGRDPHARLRGRARAGDGRRRRHGAAALARRAARRCPGARLVTPRRPPARAERGAPDALRRRRAAAGLAVAAGRRAGGARRLGAARVARCARALRGPRATRSELVLFDAADGLRARPFLPPAWDPSVRPPGRRAGAGCCCRGRLPTSGCSCAPTARCGARRSRTSRGSSRPARSAACSRAP